jgi:hypothetical protein
MTAMAEGQNNSACYIKEEDNSICINQDEFKPVYKGEPDATPHMLPVKLEPHTDGELPHAYPGGSRGTSECKPDVTHDVLYGTDMVPSAAYLGDTKAFYQH